MRILGHFEEFWPERAGIPDGRIKDSTREIGEPDEARILAYLETGKDLFLAMGAVGDVLGSDQRILSGESIATDGEWIWRADLSFYVRNYHIRLPKDFLTRVREHGYRVPDVAKGQLINLASELPEVM
ncbi:hypothetical protein [Streptomyces sioyaensis]|uniref:hypothetical protein n=1 Tax=Streptomyces sioyaensis TaxID=67364 RepID=UPI0037905DF7